jgi:hypothetical protein
LSVTGDETWRLGDELVGEPLDALEQAIAGLLAEEG